jgi:hypothetical protein
LKAGARQIRARSRRRRVPGQPGVGVTAAYRLPTPMPVYISGLYANGDGSESVFQAMDGVEL